MSDLVGFVLARIAEDEQAARFACGLNGDEPSWRVEHIGEVNYTVRSTYGWELADNANFAVSDAAHIARHDPARVLAECEAKRRIVNECGWVTVLALLALPYADHPDYRQEWTP